MGTKGHVNKNKTKEASYKKKEQTKIRKNYCKFKVCLLKIFTCSRRVEK